MDRQIRAERAWQVPYLLSQKLKGFDFPSLKRLSLTRIVRLMTVPEPLHRFPATMSRNLHAAIQRVASEYGGDARRIWRDSPGSAAVVYRFLCFEGVGPKIATMATNILARDFKIPFSDYSAI